MLCRLSPMQAVCILSAVFFIATPALAQEGTYEFSEETASGVPRGWQVNPGYPGDVSIGDENGERYLRLATISERHSGVIRQKGFPKDAQEYRLTVVARGSGLLEIGFSVWGEGRWITSLLGKRQKLEGDWSEYVATLPVPEVLAAKGSSAEVRAETLIPSIYVYEGFAEIKSLTIEGQ